MTKQTGVSCSRKIPKNNSNDDLKLDGKLQENQKGEQIKMIKVGKPAPNFTASAFYKGEFTEVSLEDYKGKWVLLCFYPGDFTFV